MTALAHQPAARTGMRIATRRNDAVAGIIITVSGDIGLEGTAELARCLHATLDAGAAVVVVDLSAVGVCDPAAREVLVVARERARDAGVGVHVVDRPRSAVHERLTTLRRGA